jgi:hypothetical protein
MTLQQLLEGQLPWWATAFATVLLSLAAAIARRVTRRSARPQGERLGELERIVRLERTRRQQVEAQLIGLGVPLAYWPPDGLQQPRRPRRDWHVDLPPRDDEDQVDEDLVEDLRTAEAPRPPVPPIPPDEAARFARHRREAHHL